MPFWAYMLHCADRSFYVGHTDNLDVRIAQHEAGLLPGYTHERRPVVLVWSENFATRLEALEAERRIKGWSRVKKLALIREDWPFISQMARNRQEKLSTSSGQTGEGQSTVPQPSDSGQTGQKVSATPNPLRLSLSKPFPSLDGRGPE